ncbi:hypothetical protein A2W14_05195, partial [Candidatus Gottesmanbacteria bacterium RBG_16_37_8]
NANYILGLLNRKDIPIYSGKAQPLKRKLINAVVHGDSGLAGADTIDTDYQLTGDADRRIFEIVKDNPNEVTILTLGPLTNIARTFLKYPACPTLINKIIMMGGAIDVCGNKNRVAEFNIFVDPEAADIVFRSKAIKILVPLDPCNKITLSLADFECLHGNYLYKPLIRTMKQFLRGLVEDEGSKELLVYDALAAYYLINPKAFRCLGMDIAVETKGEITRGMTVAEKRKKAVKNNNIEVAVNISQEEFRRDFFNILKNEVI